MLTTFSVKYPCVLQHSAEDCGAACIAAIAKYYGRTFAISRIREAVGTRQFGTTLLGLKRGAETLGFNTRLIKASFELIDNINNASLPAVIHWKDYHWVVLYGQKGKKFIIADPSVGLRYISREELITSWSDRIMLLLVPEANRFEQQPNDQMISFQRFFQTVWKLRGILGEVLLLNLIIGLLSLALPLVVQILTDEVLVRGDVILLRTVALGAIIMISFSNLLILIQSNLIAHFAQRIELGLVLDFVHQILRLPLSYYESHRSGEIVSRLRDIREVKLLISQLIISLPSESFIALVSLILMVIYSLKLTLASIGVALSMSIPALIFYSTLKNKTRDVLVTEAKNQGILVEVFKGAQTLKTMNGAPQMWDELQGRFGELANVTFRTFQIGIVNGVTSNFISGVGAIIILWLGGYLVIQEELSIGQLLAFNALYRNLSIFINTIINFIDEYARAQTALERLTDIINAKPEITEDTPKAYVQIPRDASIICTDLNFHYAGRANLLQDFSVTIPGGIVTAVIGKSGCGKSTLAKLIGSLYPLQSGNIRFGIYNQFDLGLDCLRQQVILVPQQPDFWSRSIISNFLLSYPYASLDKIVNACQITGADQFISQLPNKYQTVLGEVGANLSGGEKQRLAIARAIISDPPILILDESTSALDAVSENQVLNQLLEHRRGKTTIMISHRSQVIKRADWIIFLENGRLKQTGSPTELSNIPGEHLAFLE